MGYEQQIKHSKLADERIKAMQFGDQVTNVCAGDKNPHRLAYFVRKCGRDVECTDKNGKFWKTCKTVIFKGWLDMEECERLYKPIWESDFR